MFRIDPAKVPSDGVRARCSICGAVIAIASAPVRSADLHHPVPEENHDSAPTAAPDDQRVPGPVIALQVEPEPVVPVDAAQSAAEPTREPATPSPQASSASPATPATAGARDPEIAARGDGQPVRASEAPVESPTSAKTAVGDVSDTLTALPPGADAAPVTEVRARPVNPYLNNSPELRARRLARALVSDLVAYNPQKREQGLRDGTLRQLFREEIRKSWDEYVEQVGANVAESTPHFQDALNDVLAGGRRVF